MSKKSEQRETRERRAAMEREIAALRADLDAAYSLFDHTADPEMLEASILEIGALQSKYGCALRKLKAFLM